MTNEEKALTKEEALAALRKDSEERAANCRQEINAILVQYRCQLVPRIAFIGDQGVDAQVIIVPLKDDGS